MQTKNRDRVIQAHIDEVIKQARLNIGSTRTIVYPDGKKKRRRLDATGSLRSSLKGKFTRKNGKLLLEWNFKKYGEFLDQGVSGTRHKINESDFSFKTENPSKKHQASIESWFKARKMRLRDFSDPSKGTPFIKETPSRKRSAIFAIARAIKRRGIPRTLWFTEAKESLKAQFLIDLKEAIALDIKEEFKGNK